MSVPTAATAGKVAKLSDLRALLASFEQIPAYDENPDYYKDWGQKGEFVLKVSKGECMI